MICCGILFACLGNSRRILIKTIVTYESMIIVILIETLHVSVLSSSKLMFCVT